MGVLEARKDAETVGYPVVGETEKDASNVIDYDIREEQTLGQSSVFNANNDTTTGMANVIPGVNAPKLIANTSIYGIKGADPSTVIVEGQSASHPLGDFVYVSTVGNYGNATNQLTIPEKGTYSIDFTCWDNQIGYTPNTGHYDDYSILVNGEIVATVNTPFRLKGNVKCALELNKGDIITFDYQYDGSPTAVQTRFFEIVVTKL